MFGLFFRWLMLNVQVFVLGLSYTTNNCYYCMYFLSTIITLFHVCVRFSLMEIVSIASTSRNTESILQSHCCFFKNYHPEEAETLTAFKVNNVKKCQGPRIFVREQLSLLKDKSVDTNTKHKMNSPNSIKRSLYLYNNTFSQCLETQRTFRFHVNRGAFFELIFDFLFFLNH